MAEHPISRLFDQVVAVPDSEFEASLRRRLLEEFAVPDPRESIPSPADESRSTPPLHRLEPRRKPSEPRRPWAYVLSAAAVVALLAGAVVLLVRPDPTSRITSPPSTAAPESVSTMPLLGYSQHVVADLATADGYTYHFAGDVALKTAVESNEGRPPDGTSDVLMVPEISGTFTNTTPGKKAPLTLAYVQVFIPSALTDCVVNAAGCEPAIIRGQTTPRQGKVLEQGGSFELAATGDPSVIRLPVNDVPAVLAQVRDGTLVTGIAVVVAGQSSDQLTADVFDRGGVLVLSCDKAPVDCMDRARSVLGGGATEQSPSLTTTADNTVRHFPPGEVPPGTYALDTFAVPITITTSGLWRLYGEGSKGISLARGTNRETDFVIGAVKSQGLTTIEDVVAMICSTGSVDFSPAVSTTALGNPALQVEGVVARECDLEVKSPIVASPGDTLRLVVTEVQGFFIVVWASAPTSEWTTFAPEAEAMLASLTAR